MKPTVVVTFALFLSVFLRASEGVEGNWIAALNTDDGDVPALQLTLKAGEPGKVTGAVQHSQARYVIQTGTISDTSIVFDALQEVEPGAAPMSLSCNGVLGEGTIDLTCQVPGGAVRRYILTPHLGS